MVSKSAPTTQAPEIDLEGIDSFDSALAVINNNGLGVHEAEEWLAPEWQLVTDKDTLVGRPFFIVKFELDPEGDYGEYAKAYIVTKDNEKMLLTDGSTGIYAQLQRYEEQTGRHGGMLCRKGLRRSDYSYENPETGKKEPAKTYYIDTSK